MTTVQTNPSLTVPDRSQAFLDNIKGPANWETMEAMQDFIYEMYHSRKDMTLGFWINMLDIRIEILAKADMGELDLDANTTPELVTAVNLITTAYTDRWTQQGYLSFHANDDVKRYIATLSELAFFILAFKETCIENEEKFTGDNSCRSLRRMYNQTLTACTLVEGLLCGSVLLDNPGFMKDVFISAAQTSIDMLRHAHQITGDPLATWAN